MGNPHAQQGAFSIPDVIGIVPERLKPWLFIFFVIIVQFSGGVYLAAACRHVGELCRHVPSQISLQLPHGHADMLRGNDSGEYRVRHNNLGAAVGGKLSCCGLVPHVGHFPV